MSHFVADNQVIPSSLTLNIMFLFSATCPTCRQRLDQAEEEGEAAEEGKGGAAEDGEEGAAEEEEGGEEEWGLNWAFRICYISKLSSVQSKVLN